MKRVGLGIILIILITTLMGCATSVSVRHLVPGQVDLTDARNLALSSTAAYKFSFGRPLSPWVSGLQGTDFTLSSGYDYGLSDDVASLATRKIASAVSNTQYFNTLDPEVTDAYLKLSKAGDDGKAMMFSKGYDALLSSEITYMDVEERIEGEDIKEFVANSSGGSTELVARRDYYLIQEATLSLSYKITSLSGNQLLASHSYTDKKVSRLRVGSRYYASDGSFQDERTYSRGFAPSFLPLFSDILDNMTEKMSTELAPSWETVRLHLMANKPKNSQAELALEYAKDRQYQVAYNQYLSIWNQSGHVSSGYNAALMLAGLGDLEGSVNLMNEVYNQSNNKKAYSTLLVLQEALSQDKMAQRQINGELVDDGQGVTMTQYMVVE